MIPLHQRSYLAHTPSIRDTQLGAQAHPTHVAFLFYSGGCLPLTISGAAARACGADCRPLQAGHSSQRR